jgi:multiple sugar transport system permease protein
MAWVLVAIIAVFTAVNFLGARRWVFYGDES